MVNELGIDSAVESFAEIARRYCAWAESPSGEPRFEMLTARRLLIEIHRAAIALPDLGPGENTEDAISADTWKAVYARFQKLPVYGYWDVFNPFQEEAPVFNTLPDDMSDAGRYASSSNVRRRL